MYGPVEAVTEGFRNYLDTKRLASRSEYWWFAFFYYAVVWLPLVIIVYYARPLIDLTLQASQVFQETSPTEGETFVPAVLPPAATWIVTGLSLVSILGWITLRIPMFTVLVRRVRDAGGWVGWPWLKLITVMVLLFPTFLAFLLIVSIYLSGGDLLIAVMEPNFLVKTVLYLIGYVASPVIAIPTTLILILSTIASFLYTFVPSKYL